MAESDDNFRALKPDSPELRIMFLLFGQAAKDAYAEVSKQEGVNYSRLPKEFWQNATSRLADSYNTWVSVAILEQAKKKNDKETYKALKKLLKEVLEDRKSRSFNKGHKNVCDMWEKLNCNIVNEMDKLDICSDEEDEHGSL